MGTVNYTFSPTLVNQATYNFSYNYFSYYQEDPSNIARQLVNGTAGTPQAGQPLPSLFPLHPLGPGTGGDMLEGPANCSNGYCNYLPSFSFGGTNNAALPPNSASFAAGSTGDYVNTNRIKQFTDNLSKVWGNHSIKAGIYTEYNRKLQPGGIGYLGSYNFQTEPETTLRTRIMGLPTRCSENYDTPAENEVSGHFVYDVYYWNTEFYLQDDWRIGKASDSELAGIRAYHVSPQIDKLNEFSFTWIRPNLPEVVGWFLACYTPGCDRKRRACYLLRRQQGWCSIPGTEAQVLLPPTLDCMFLERVTPRMEW